MKDGIRSWPILLLAALLLVWAGVSVSQSQEPSVETAVSVTGGIWLLATWTTLEVQSYRRRRDQETSDDDQP